MNHNAAKSILAQRLIPMRASMREQNRILRRARRLYIFLVRDHINTTDGLMFCAKRMQDAGLYSELTGQKDVRFSILRNKWKRESGKGWHQWLRGNGWMFGKFIKEVAA